MFVCSARCLIVSDSNFGESFSFILSDIRGKDLSFTVPRTFMPLATLLERLLSTPLPSTCISHHDDIILSAMASHINCLTSVYSTVYSGANQRKHQSSASLAFVRGIHRWPVKSPHKWPVTRKVFPFDDVFIYWDFVKPKLKFHCFQIHYSNLLNHRDSRSKMWLAKYLGLRYDTTRRSTPQFGKEPVLSV